MIPIRLTLKNFMSYGPQGETLLFQDLHVACLAGDNGNGKSALLDAMTWALWGKTRVSAVAGVTDEDLIRSGADEVEVTFEFQLESELYRVVRRKKRGRAAGGDWQFAQRDAEGNYQSVAGGSQRETGRLIASLLSMEYETFLNSAYLQQGRADEFTRQTPAKRKAILSEILGLERYDRLEARAREIWRAHREQAEELAREVALLDAAIARRPGLVEERDAVKLLVAEQEARITPLEQEAQSRRDARRRLEEAAARAEEGRQAVARIDADIASRSRDLTARLARMAQIDETLRQGSVILEDYSKWRKAHDDRNQLEPEIEALNRTARELEIAKAAIEMEGVKLQAEQKSHALLLDAVERRAAELGAVERQIGQLEAELRDEHAAGCALQEAEQKLATARDAFSELRAQNESLKRTQAELDEVLEVLGLPRAACPICESDLSGERQSAVLARQQEKRDALAEQLKLLQSEGRDRKQAVDGAQTAVNACALRSKELAASRSRVTALMAQAAGLREAGVDVQTLARSTAEQARQIEAEEFAQPTRARCKRLQGDLDRLLLVKPRYEEARATATRLAGTEKRYVQLQDAERNQTGERASLEEAERGLEVRRSELAAERERVAALSAELAGSDEVRRASEAADQELARARAEAGFLLKREATLQHDIDACDRAAADRKERAVRHREVDRERALYQQLTAAFGKKGIQAYIIENVIPELEETANALLARMTDSAMQVRFETTRSARAGGHEIETLDIRVLDQSGTRAYELFSGGEGFRLNFAIRLALSRLLARRAGAQLQTLILDEGFGTQDGKGREKLVEVIDSIKGEFRKILVITHVDELKDAFSQRIEVSKDATGSHIHLL